MVIFVNGEEVGGGGGGGGGGDVGDLDDVTNLLIVNGEASSGGDGSWATPFDLVQDALSYIEGLLDASSTNKYHIKVFNAPNENLIFRCPYTTLTYEGEEDAQIQPTTGPALFWTNATTASVATYLATGAGTSSATADAQVGVLVADVALTWPNGVTTPIESRIQGVTYKRPAAVSTQISTFVVMAGDGAESAVLYKYMRDVTMEGFYFRNNLIMTLFRVSSTRDTYVRQCRLVSFYKSNLLATNFADFDPAGETPAAPYDTVGQCSYYDGYGYSVVVDTYASAVVNKMHLTGPLTSRGNSIMTASNCSTQTIAPSGSTTFTAKNCFSELVIQCTSLTNATINMRNCWGAENGVSISESGGVNVVNFYGGNYIGPIVDPTGLAKFHTPPSARPREVPIAVDTVLTSNQVDNTTVVVDASAVAPVVTLPVLTSAEVGFETTIKCVGAFGCTPTAGSGQTIDGAATFPLTDKEAITLRFSGTTIWRIV